MTGIDQAGVKDGRDQSGRVKDGRDQSGRVKDGREQSGRVKDGRDQSGINKYLCVKVYLCLPRSYTCIYVG
jgi:hypothetical protein